MRANTTGMLLRRRFLVALVTVALAAAISSAHAEQVPAHPIQSKLWLYGDTSGEWSGADGAYSVLLPDDRTAWIFSDTFYGPVTDGTRYGSRLLRNSIVVQDADGEFVDTIVGENVYGDADTLVKTEDGATWYWMGDGTVERTADGDKLRVFVLQFSSVPPPFTQIADNIATFSLPDLTLEGVTRLPLGMSPSLGNGLVGWGSAVMETQEHTYIYGIEDLRTAKHLHLARAPRNGLLGAWEYWTGSEWSADPLMSARLLNRVSNEMSVHPTPNGYTLIAQEDTIGPDVMACHAPAPQGPWGSCRDVYTTPEHARGLTVYNAKAHPQLSDHDSITVSYNVNINSLTLEPHYKDVTIYRPRFVEIPMPAGF